MRGGLMANSGLPSLPAGGLALTDPDFGAAFEAVLSWRRPSPEFRVSLAAFSAGDCGSSCSSVLQKGYVGGDIRSPNCRIPYPELG